jgi:hypothetical protein
MLEVVDHEARAGESTFCIHRRRFVRQEITAGDPKYNWRFESDHEVAGIDLVHFACKRTE